jgi:hypothetical protein
VVKLRFLNQHHDMECEMPDSFENFVKKWAKDIEESEEAILLCVLSHGLTFLRMTQPECGAFRHYIPPILDDLVKSAPDNVKVCTVDVELGVVSLP